MHPEDLQVGAKYQQVRGGIHIGEIVEILRIKQGHVRYRILHTGPHKNQLMNVAQERFLMNFERK